jgi:AraC-like DNA-binding protein
LPDAIVVSAADEPGASRLRMLMSAIQEELESARAAAEAIAADLASALFVMVVRIHLDREGSDRGLLGLLAHRQVGRAVAAMLDDPARNWTLDELAARANASRASLVRMFQRSVQLAARIPRRTKARACLPQAARHHAPGRGDRRRGRLQVGKRLQPRLLSPLRHAAQRGACRRFSTSAVLRASPTAVRSPAVTCCQGIRGAPKS